MVEHWSSINEALGLILTTIKETDAQNPLKMTSREMDLLSRVAHGSTHSQE